MIFKDRTEAGQKLSQKLKDELVSCSSEEVIVLVIPRGGVAVGKEISQSLGFPIDCLITKKIPSPENEELSIGAVAEGGIVVWEEELCRRLAITSEYKQTIVKAKVDELEKKKQDFRCGITIPQIKDKIVILVDDGIATGATIKAAIAVVRNFSPKEVVVAVPVISQDALNEIKQKADKIVYLEAPEMFFSVNQFYENFDQLSDEQVINMLKK